MKNLLRYIKNHFNKPKVGQFWIGKTNNKLTIIKVKGNRVYYYYHQFPLSNLSMTMEGFITTYEKSTKTY